ncbi:MAG: type II/IV secretion system protein [Planctomycetes bacterium]|nr:type II/IV secretion system protein [Planctomycetota bacterium]
MANRLNLLSTSWSPASRLGRWAALGLLSALVWSASALGETGRGPQPAPSSGPAASPGPPGFGRPRHWVFVGVVSAVCGAWFTLVAAAQRRRGDAASFPARLDNTLNFLTLGLAGLQATVKKEEKTVITGAEGDIKEIQAGPALKAVREIIVSAVRQGASDIHLEPKGDDLQVRLRIDGDLVTDRVLESRLGTPVIACLKVAADMDIAERRRPQDGSFSMALEDHTVDFRVSTAPSAQGEKMALRVLDRTRGVRHLVDLGFQPEMLDQMRRIVRLPHGMLIVCGPTGSGKTTTLYASLGEIDAQRKNVITIENPVEYHLPNVNQTPINEKAGLSFAKALRSALRQDPDVIMVGEIRDVETAQIAAQASMTGHLVFTTLHANDSVSSVYRLLDLELDPSTLCTALRAVLAQRLVRKICPECRQPDDPKPEAIQWCKRHGIADPRFFRPSGSLFNAPCPKCSGQGYRGRIGVFELLILNDAMRAIIQSRPALTDLQAKAGAAGLIELRGDALLKAAQGMTSMEEVLSLSGL